MQHLALAQTSQRAWSTSIGDGSSRYTRVMSQPVIAKGRVYAMDGAVQVSALDAQSGSVLWKIDLKPEEERGNAFGGGPCFWNDRLFVSIGHAQVLALDPADGKVIWRQNVTAPVHAPPTVADGRVFVVTVENELNALSADDGRRLWVHNGIPETAGLLGRRQPRGRRRGRRRRLHIRRAVRAAGRKRPRRSGPTIWRRRAMSMRFRTSPISAAGR